MVGVHERMRLDISGLKLDVDTTLTQDLTLDVGVVTEAVKVTAQTSLVQTTSGEIGTTVSLAHVQEMALADRNIYRLVNMVPGAFVSNAGGQAAGTSVLNVAVSTTWYLSWIVVGVTDHSTVTKSEFKNTCCAAVTPDLTHTRDVASWWSSADTRAK